MPSDQIIRTRVLDLSVPIGRSEERDVVDPLADKFAAVAQLWRTSAGAAFAPAWSGVDLMTYPSSALPNLMVADFLGDGQFRFRYWGRGFSRIFGVDYSTKKVTDVRPSWVSGLIGHQFMRIVETRRPLLFETEFDDYAEPITEIRLPISNDGERVSGVIGFSDIDDVTPVVERRLVRGFGF